MTAQGGADALRPRFFEEGNGMEWLEITVDTSPAGIEPVSGLLESLGITELVIDDEHDFESFLENNRQYWDYVDEELARQKRGVSRVTFYLEAGERDRLDRVKAALAELKALAGETYGPLTAAEKTVRDEDWESEYKKYYRPLEIGEKLLILPEWEQEPAGNTRRVLRLDPGVAFGTGSHATTRLCLELMEGAVRPGAAVLDLGSGSGILSVGALLLGAGSALGVDIDPLAADTAEENAARNGYGPPRCRFVCGNVLTDRDLRERFAAEKADLVLANIVADVIIPLSGFVGTFLKDGGRFLCSGILADRAAEVEEALARNGFAVLEKRVSEDWCAYLCCRHSS